MKKRLVSLLFAVIFLLLCLFPSVGLAVTGGAKAGANEVLAAKPSLTRRDGSFNPGVLAELADYVGDRFFLRQEAVTGWAGLNAALFRRSVTDSVILGRNGWLYYEPTLADYTRSRPMTDRELWCAARTLYLIQEAAEKAGASFLFAAAPNKNSLYDGNMPPLTRLDGAGNAERLQALLAGMGVNCLDLFAVFRAEGETLYFPTDSHWNGRGAALAADAILAALGRESRYFDGPFSASEHVGDLYEMLYPAGTAADGDFAYGPGFTFTASSQNPDNPAITARGPGEGRLLMYRDSFGRNLYPYLAESFEESEFSRRNDYAPGTLAPGDAMVVELVERNLRYLNQNPPTLAAPERSLAPEDVPVPGGESVKLRLAKSALIGYTVLRGEWAAAVPDDDSPVYIAAGDAVYEAVPLPEGFSLNLPEEAAAEADRQILIRQNGVWTALPGILIS